MLTNFAPIIPLSVGVLLADPPWYFQNFSEKGEEKNPVAHYDCMDLEEIKKMPVGQLMKPGSVCVMWATAPMLPDAIDTLKAWGFKYKTAGTWGKQSKTGDKIAFGTGYIYRTAAEFWVVGTIGRPKQKNRSTRNFILAPIQEHSRKPEQMYEDIEKLWDGPYLELFARRRRSGWQSWGNELTSTTEKSNGKQRSSNATNGA